MQTEDDAPYGQNALSEVDDDDAQRHLVYAWERRYHLLPLPTEVLTRKQTLGLVVQISSDIGLPIPDFQTLPPNADHAGHFAPPNNWSWSKNVYHPRPLIAVMASYRFNFVVCHEMAHYRLDGTRAHPHGPSFMGVYFQFLQKYADEKIESLESTACLGGIGWDYRVAKRVLPWLQDHSARLAA